MNLLEELGKKYGTDKIGKHHYLPVYYDFFKNKSKRRKVKKVLEIGVGEGAGLRMFRDFFTNATIYGAEIDEKRIFKEDRIEVFKCDQSKSEDLINLIHQIGADLDLVIDDGSHREQDQIFSLLKIFPALKLGAIYIIEDVAKEDIFKRYVFPPNTKMMTLSEGYDDRLVICRK